MRREAEADERFLKGNAVIQQKLAELAARMGMGHESVERRDNDSESYVYSLRGLRGVTRSVAFRAKDIRSAAVAETFQSRIEPRLEAMFEDLWWRRAVILMRAGEDLENLRRS